MRSDFMPIINLRLDFLSREISSSLGAEGSELAKQMEKEIRNQFAKSLIEFKKEIPEKIKVFINNKINQCLVDFFSYGQGDQYITKIIENAFNKVIKEKIKDFKE